jgi:hypothetical protein
MDVDKNLQNVVDDLDQSPPTSHEAQQRNQARYDRRKRSADGKKGYQENENSYR